MDKAVVGAKISLEECQPGMKIITNVVDQDNSILAINGSIITEELLVKLKKHNVKEVVVYSKDIGKWQKKKILNKLKKEYKRNIKKETTTTYKNSVKIMDDIIFEIEKGEKLKFSKIKAITLPLLNEIVKNNNYVTCLEIMKKERNEIYNHSVNTAILSGLLCKWMKYNKQSIYRAIVGGLLHDIGLCQIPCSIIDKKDYTEEELDLIHQHPLFGYESVISNKEIDIEVKKMILAHHENCDGTGYPFGLKKEKISYETKILSVADRFDEKYFKNDASIINIFNALEQLYKNEFTKLEYKALNVFTNNMLWNNIGRYVHLSNDAFGQIVYINERNKFKPLIKVDKNIIDLSKNKTIKIVDIV